MGIKRDHGRFKNIVKGKIKHDLAKYISHGEMTGSRENDLVKIPIPSIDIPNFRFGSANENGVGQGSGDPSDGNSSGMPQSGEGAAGENPGEHNFQVEMTIDELAEVLGESLSLPNIEPRGDKSLENFKSKYTSLAKVGPQGLKNVRTTFKRSLKRSMALGEYKPGHVIVPIKDDFKYKSPKEVQKPDSKAIVFYIMDVSGSMGDKQKKLVQTEVFWINAWIKKNYKHVETSFIIHDAQAQEVSEQEFFTISANGGTLISTAYKLCQKMIEENYNPADWNIYVFQFSDGDNWSEEDNNVCVKMLQDFFLPIVNSFNYGQVESSHGSGNYLKVLDSKVNNLRLNTSSFKNNEEILLSIKKFLGKGH